MLNAFLRRTQMDDELVLIKVYKPPYKGYMGDPMPEYTFKQLVPKSWTVDGGKIDVWCKNNNATSYFVR